MPAIVTVDELLVPALTVEPSSEAILITPLLTVSLTLRLVASTSATLIRLPPVNTKTVSSLTVTVASCTVLIGASLRPVILTKISVVVAGVVE